MIIKGSAWRSTPGRERSPEARRREPRAHLARPPFSRRRVHRITSTEQPRRYERGAVVPGGIPMSHYKLLAAASGLALMTAAGAHAQTAPAPVSDSAQVDEVVVTGVRKSLREALDVKRGSDKVVEAISAKDIGVLPDVTIAESIARLPGVNATRDRGNDSQAVVRGLGARLVLGTINNREVASSEPDRNVRWEIYPSEVVSGVQVYKSQSADLVAGGVAATINISTLDPLDYKGPELVLRAGPVFYDGGKDIPNYST